MFGRVPIENRLSRAVSGWATSFFERTSSGDIFTENSDYYIGDIAMLMIYQIALAWGCFFFFCALSFLRLFVASATHDID